MALKTLRGSITIADVSDGAKGDKGENGKSINWLGESSTPPTNPQDYDAYYDTEKKKSYLYYEGKWHYFAQDGIDGKDGKDGVAYDLIFNKDKIIKYKTQENGQYITTIAPKELTFYLTLQDPEQSMQIIDKDNYGFSLSLSNLIDLFSFTEELESNIDTLNSELEEINLLSFFSYSKQNLLDLCSFSPFIRVTDKSVWEISLDKLLNTYLNYQKVTGILEKQVYIAFHTADNNIDFNSNLSWSNISNGDKVYVGIYFPNVIEKTQWEEKPSKYERYTWQEYKTKTDTDDDPTFEIQKKALKAYNIGHILNSNEVIFTVDVYGTNSETNENFILGIFSLLGQWASSENLATFSVKADSIVSAIDNSKLQFSSDGLTITNGGLRILNKNEETILDFKEETGDLIISGELKAATGTFSGSLEAATGSFKGSLEAASGTFAGELAAATGSFKGLLEAASGSFTGELTAAIGNIKDLKIGNTDIIQLYSTTTSDGQTVGGIKHIPADGNELNSNFSIDLNGHVIAKSIELNNGSIGDINFGNSTISANNGSWSISPDTAVFNNIVAQGKITTAVFEKNSIQLCGGSFLFKDGIILTPITVTSVDVQAGQVKISEIKELKTDCIYLLTTQARETGIYCEYINKENEFYLKFYSEAIIGTYDLIIDFGPMVNNVATDLVIGVNSTASPFLNSGLEANSITFSTLNKIEQDNGQFNYVTQPKIVLGKFPQSLKQNNNLKDTYGLYAESVYLTGTLATKVGSDSYAGVNTLDGVKFTHVDKEIQGLTSDNSKIVFWAGSADMTEAGIQTAKFQVTEQGTLYATQAIFSDSIIANSRIEAGQIDTAIIKGKDDGAALIIQDADIGIDFRDKDNNSAMLITTGQMQLKMPLIFLEDNSEDNSEQVHIQNANFYGKKIKLSSTDKSIHLSPNGIDFFNEPTELDNFFDTQGSDGKEKELHGLYYFKIDADDNFNLNYRSDNLNLLQCKKETKLDISCDFGAKNNFYLGKNSNEAYTASYKPAISPDSKKFVGIDLYIDEILIS